MACVNHRLPCYATAHATQQWTKAWRDMCHSFMLWAGVLACNIRGKKGNTTLSVRTRKGQRLGRNSNRIETEKTKTKVKGTYTPPDRLQQSNSRTCRHSRNEIHLRSRSSEHLLEPNRAFIDPMDLRVRAADC